MDSHPAITQKFWTDEFNRILKREYNLKKNLKSVFIDTYYQKESQFETEVFHNNSQNLFDYALSREPFECKLIREPFGTDNNNYYRQGYRDSSH